MSLTKIETDGIKDDAVTSGKIPANAVGSSEIADQAVTLDKLPHGTSSQDGKFLRANNGADPSFETVTSTTINNNASTKFITGSNSANTLDAESNLSYNNNLVTFADSSLTINKSTSPTISVIETSGNKSGQLRANTDGVLLRTLGNYPLLLGTNQSERMRIDSSGNVAIARTSADARLHIDTNHYVVSNSGISTTGIHLDGTHGNAGEYGGGISFGCGGDGSAAIAARQATSSQHVVGLSFFTHDSSTASANAVEKVRIHDGGTTSFNNGICLGNGVTLSSANTMDDYETGTYVPTITGQSGGSISIYSSENRLSYTKVGNIVHVHGRIRLHIVNTTMSGQARLSLPFTADSGSNTSNAGMSAVATHGVTLNSSSDVGMFLETASGSPLGYLTITRFSASWVSVTANQFGGLGATSNHYLTFNHTYQAS